MGGGFGWIRRDDLASILSFFASLLLVHNFQVFFFLIFFLAYLPYFSYISMYI